MGIVFLKKLVSRKVWGKGVCVHCAYLIYICTTGNRYREKVQVGVKVQWEG